MIRWKRIRETYFFAVAQFADADRTAIELWARTRPTLAIANVLAHFTSDADGNFRLPTYAPSRTSYGKACVVDGQQIPLVANGKSRALGETPNPAAETGFCTTAGVVDLLAGRTKQVPSVTQDASLAAVRRNLLKALFFVSIPAQRTHARPRSGQARSAG